MDPALSAVVVAAISSGATLAGTLLVQHRSGKAETETAETEAENARITDLKAYYTQLLSDRDARNSELSDENMALRAELRAHNDALAKNNEILLKSAASQERMMETLHTLLGLEK